MTNRTGRAVRRTLATLVGLAGLGVYADAQAPKPLLIKSTGVPGVYAVADQPKPPATRLPATVMPGVPLPPPDLPPPDLDLATVTPAAGKALPGVPVPVEPAVARDHMPLAPIAPTAPKPPAPLATVTPARPLPPAIIIPPAPASAPTARKPQPSAEPAAPLPLPGIPALPTEPSVAVAPPAPPAPAPLADVPRTPQLLVSPVVPQVSAPVAAVPQVAPVPQASAPVAAAPFGPRFYTSAEVSAAACPTPKAAKCPKGKPRCDCACAPATVPPPVGSAVRTAFAAQRGNALDEYFVVFREEFDQDTDTLNPTGERHVGGIARRFEQSRSPVKVEPTGDPGLDERRRTAVISELSKAGVPVAAAAARVQGGSTRADGMPPTDIEPTHVRYGIGGPGVGGAGAAYAGFTTFGPYGPYR